MDTQDSATAPQLSASYMNSSASHPLSPQEDEQVEAKDYFSSNARAGRHGPSPSIDGLLSAEDNAQQDEAEAQTPGGRHSTVKASRLPLFTPEAQESSQQVSETILQLPKAPHLLKSQDLADGLCAFAGSNTQSHETPLQSLPTDLVVAIVSALSQDLSDVDRKSVV